MDDRTRAPDAAVRDVLRRRRVRAALAVSFVLFASTAWARGGGHGGAGHGGGAHGGGAHAAACASAAHGHGAAHGGSVARPGGFGYGVPPIRVVPSGEFQLWRAPDATFVMRGNPDPPFEPYFSRLDASPNATRPVVYVPAGPPRAEVIRIRFVDEIPRRRRHRTRAPIDATYE